MRILFTYCLAGLKTSLSKETDTFLALLPEADETLQPSGKSANLSFNKLAYISLNVKITGYN